ncbi:serine/threonine-protein kinase [Phormidium sp. CCY1219]|uniref:serine/threonine-protein kinase n=1 Tax=Phormidium sp. CCY1219 TaxID=2886104 RepID=UPI002D1F65D6|nr:serine/threonine-protein kinase [Phormidium sp. CCY1219]MEB3831356.1 serine/threonine protein kinase [Phormidium sp. CCY1219]
MSYCINPNCPKPADPLNGTNRICRQCGSELLLNGRYRVQKLLGTGGFGLTFEADDRGFAKVLKVLTESNPKAIALFKQEARVLQRLRHPGIPIVEPGGYFTVFPRGRKTAVHCLVMEKIEGQNLEAWMADRNHSPISQQQAMNWLLQLAEILHQVHGQQYFHRDIKPSNIMLRSPSPAHSFSREQLALIDFGSAREVSRTYLAKMAVGQKGTVISSKGYAPPEQENGFPVPQSDFFGLGRTFVELLTGKHPLDFYDPHTDKLLWRKAAPQISPQLADFIDNLMARLPGQRPQSTEVILQRLAELELVLYGGTRGVVRFLPSPLLQSGWLSRLGRFKKQWLVGAVVVAIAGVGLAEMQIYLQGDRIGGEAKESVSPVSSPNLDLSVATSPAVAKPSGNGDRPPAAQMAVEGRPGTGSSARSIPAIAQNISFKEITLANTLTGHSQDVRSVAIGQQGKILASGSFDGTIKIWNLHTGKPIRTLTGHSEAGEMVSSVAIAADGKTLASSSNGYGGTIKVWNLVTGELLYTLSARPTGVSFVTISPNSQILASGAEDGTIQLWNLEGGYSLGTLSGHLGTVFSVAFSPDGKTLASGSQDGSIKLWNLADPNSDGGFDNAPVRQLSGHVGTVFSVAFSPNGKVLASGGADNTIKLWDLSTDAEFATLASHAGTMFAVAFSPDGETVAGGTLTGRIKLWNLDTRELVETLSAHSRWVESIAFSPDGHTLASGSGDRTIKIWGVR